MGDARAGRSLKRRSVPARPHAGTRTLGNGGWRLAWDSGQHERTPWLRRQPELGAARDTDKLAIGLGRRASPAVRASPPATTPTTEKWRLNHRGDDGVERRGMFLMRQKQQTNLPSIRACSGSPHAPRRAPKAAALRVAPRMPEQSEAPIGATHRRCSSATLSTPEASLQYRLKTNTSKSSARLSMERDRHE
jgi:hypothetical protein